MLLFNEEWHTFVLMDVQEIAGINSTGIDNKNAAHIFQSFI